MVAQGEEAEVSWGNMGCGSGRVCELLGRFSRRVSTAVIACTTLIAETQNNQL